MCFFRILYYYLKYNNVRIRVAFIFSKLIHLYRPLQCMNNSGGSILSIIINNVSMNHLCKNCNCNCKSFPSFKRSITQTSCNSVCCLELFNLLFSCLSLSTSSSKVPTLYLLFVTKIFLVNSNKAMMILILLLLVNYLYL